MKRRWMIGFALLAGMFPMSLGAASTYASAAFQAQWQQGEAITPNFWGPLASAKDSQQEDYKEAPSGKRTVQYFDKGRMELGANGAVTSGLLATELVKGQVQVGDAAYAAKAAPTIPIAGDPDNVGPTYAALGGKAASLLAPASSQVGGHVSANLSPTGDLTSGTLPANPGTSVSAFDDATKHNLPLAFADYRNRAGLTSIGYAISEPFAATVKVGGAQKSVVIQVFERRVLTYTESNPDAFKVEMGNIGQHYYQWRYPNGAPVASAPQVAAPPTDTIARDALAEIGNPADYTVKKLDMVDLAGDGKMQALLVLQKKQPTGGHEVRELASLMQWQGAYWRPLYRSQYRDDFQTLQAGIKAYPKTDRHPGFALVESRISGATPRTRLRFTVLRWDEKTSTTSIALDAEGYQSSVTVDDQTGGLRHDVAMFRVNSPECCPSFQMTRTWVWDVGHCGPTHRLSPPIPIIRAVPHRRSG